MSDKGTEYVFILPDNSVRYEIVFEASDIKQFREMHNSVRSMPVRYYESLQSYKVTITNPGGVNNNSFTCNGKQIAGIIRPVTGDDNNARQLQNISTHLKRGESVQWEYDCGVKILIENKQNPISHSATT
jgi:hypothetical protein